MRIGQRAKVTYISHRGETVHTKVKFVNHWLRAKDEGITWVRGWNDTSERTRALLAAHALSATADAKSAR